CVNALATPSRPLILEQPEPAAKDDDTMSVLAASLQKSAKKPPGSTRKIKSSGETNTANLLTPTVKRSRDNN
ncbi:hypothetical protein, partial [Methylobacterium indicum]|uniref:hypothetical protein n=1 Tax=Methylobacterium indicum TaxID=1775910 RepID=UPI001AD8B99C